MVKAEIQPKKWIAIVGCGSLRLFGSPGTCQLEI